MGPDVRLIDTSDAVARRTVALAGDLPAVPGSVATPHARLWTTGDLGTLQDFVHRWLDFPCTLAPLTTPAD
jgi:glutamate racemase